MSLLDSFVEEELLAGELRQTVDYDTPGLGLREIFLAIRSDGDPGSDPINPRVVGDGTRQNPFAANTALQFNFIVSKYGKAKNLTVRLGPGVFRSEGGFSSDSLYPFVLRDGMRIVGSGMFNTVLRLTAVPITRRTARPFAIIGGDTNPANTPHNVEISDLTIDCNLGDQPWSTGRDYAWMMATAVSLYRNDSLGIESENCRLRRVRVINFGTRAGQRRDGANEPSTWEGFPIFFDGSKHIVEDCIFEQPFRGCARETTILAMGGAHNVVRNNYFNGAYVNPSNGLPVQIDSITSSGTTVTVRTRFPHNVCASRPYSGGGPDYILIKGSTQTAYNDVRWPVTSPALEDPMSRQLTFEMASPPGAATGGTVEQSFPPTMRVSSAVVSGGILTITTATAHYRQLGDYVAITGADLVATTNGKQDLFNGTYKITGGVTSTAFEVTLDANVTSLTPGNPSGDIWLDHRPGSLFTTIRYFDGEEDDFWCLWGDMDHGFDMSEGLATITMLAWGNPA